MSTSTLPAPALAGGARPMPQAAARGALRAVLGVAIGALLSAAWLVATPAAAAPAASEALPLHLRDTGLDAPDVIAFEPRHALWSDGAAKRRWIRLPPGGVVDASDPDAWRFPRGTRLWKEFAYGQRLETRYAELGRDGRWRWASYVWTADGQDAVRAPAAGIARLPAAEAPGGTWAIPSAEDCLVCHADARSPVLGFTALQLGDLLPPLVQRGLVVRGPAAWRQAAPAMPGRSDAERAARGMLNANCGHCHHERGVPVPLVLAPRVAGGPVPDVGPLQAALARMGTRDPWRQMPPLGTRVVDHDGRAALQAWLAERTAAAPSPR